MKTKDKIDQLVSRKGVLMNQMIFHSDTKSPLDLQELINEYNSINKEIINIGIIECDNIKMDERKNKILKIKKRQRINNFKNIIYDKLGFKVH